MTTLENEFLREEVQKLRSALKRYEDKNYGGHSVDQDGDFLREDNNATSRMNERRSLGLQNEEIDKYPEEFIEQLHFYQGEMGKIRLKIENVTKENERLHEQLKESLEKQLESIPSGFTTEAFTEQELIKNLQEQLQLANQEKEDALELWQNVSQEMDRLQQQYQGHITQAHLHVAERQKQQEQLAHLEQLNKQLLEAKEKAELTNQQFLHTVNKQQLEREQLGNQLRQAKQESRIATVKLEETTKLIENLQEQLQRKEEDEVAAKAKEEASEKRVQHIQSAFTQLETRLKVAVQDVEKFKDERIALEKHIGELQAKCAEVEEEKYDAVSRVRDSMQILEEANLQKDQALLREKQKEEEIENMKEGMNKIIQEAAARTRKEVENTRKLFNVQIARLTEELSAAQMECGDKQSQLERAMRERRAAEEELAKVYRDGQLNEKDYRKQEELHQRFLNAERMKDDLQIRLHAAQNKIKQMELNFSEDLSRCHETMEKLNKTLESERESSNSVSEERLKLVQENEQLRKEVDEWRKTATEVQQKVKFQISTLEHEFSVKEQGFEVQLQEMEDSKRNSINELRRLLLAQQKATNQWKEEARKITESTEARLGNLRTELKRQKRHSEELLSRLHTAQEQKAEFENVILEYQEKANRLQKRLDQAEERALTASKQLNLIASQRRTAAHKVDLQNM
ncbi:sodium channel and clathrin linker 1 isoform 1 [Xenopus tropicalis]|uniref:Sodium channel and clathrin linker 1 isoform 1 n=1 Tax=Xenopus tropicalis TaxID=8364 RepID=A0A8J0QFL2_XENTR|nr:sodium channel and clathrin linker 1 isoform 1 [Xenopus tropicalis]|eukprot:NP_001186859.1 sodium channel and clathrin linker 1 isoform 1 [Xenopus tropicalis]